MQNIALKAKIPTKIVYKIFSAKWIQLRLAETNQFMCKNKWNYLM